MWDMTYTEAISSCPIDRRQSFIQMSNRSSSFHYHIKVIIDRAKRNGASDKTLQKLIEIAAKWEERRTTTREEQSSIGGQNG